ncbi:MAG: SDR family oxidoreductase [Rhodospirillales bacterium]|nr:SDR family oxidoreductase [Rhodospirillales bacterium]
MASRRRQQRLFCFGFGFSAQVLAERLGRLGWGIAGTCRDAGKRRALAARGVDAWLFDRDRPLEKAPLALEGATAMLVSAPPDRAGDPVLDHHGGEIAALDLDWIGYLSTTGVYGDTGGETVDEDAPLRPSSARSRRRVAAEAAWLDLGRRHGLPVHVFRLAGIYGPGRSALDQVRLGRIRRIDRPGHLFSRIHVDDIATVAQASMARPHPGRVYNVCDDEPAAQADVVAFACSLLGVEPPPPIPFALATQEMSAMALSFWADNRRVDNARIKDELAVTLAHPDYRAGLRAVLAAERRAGKNSGAEAGLSR